MAGLCGWIGLAGGREPESVLRVMAARLLPADAAHSGHTVSGDVALAARAPCPGPVATGTDGLLAAVDGCPRFVNAERARLARSAGTGAALLAAYRELGAEVTAAVKGPFAAVLVDAPRRRGLLAVDRFGIRPLAYARTSAGLVFATSLDAMREHPDLDLTVSPAGVYRYMLNTVSPAPRTIYDQADKLPPGHRIQYRNGEVKTERYWRVPYAPERGRDPREVRAELYEVLDQAIARARSRDGAGRSGRHGVFMSGGFDSSTVGGLTRRQDGQSTPAFTISFQDEGFDEAAFAESASRHLGLEQHTRVLRPSDATAVLGDLARTFDEPFGNSSVIPTYYCAHHARTHGVDLLLAGDGGDELFAGNKRYVEQKMLGVYHQLPALVRRAAEAALMSRDGTADLPDPVGKLQRYVRRANTPMPERMTQFHVVDPRRLETVFEPDALAAIDADEPLAIWRERYRSAASDDRLQAMQHLDMQTALADNDLRKVGRACDLAGVGVAFPFLDEEVAAFAARLPPEWLIRRFELRAFYRDATKGFLPDDVRTKKKQGFGMPFPIWARGDPELAETFDACLAGLRQRGLFRADFLETVRANHRRAEPTPHDQIIYDLVMLELWHWERGL